MMKAVLLLILQIICLAQIISAQAPLAPTESYQTIRNNGSAANRVDIAILGDGYQADELAQYRLDAEAFISRVFNEEPFREYQRYFNVHRIDAVSIDSGADHPEDNPPAYRNTAFDAAYNCGNIERLICVSNQKVNAAIARTLPPSHFDIILVLVNDTEYGGSGGTIAVSSKDPAASEIILHEIGHSFGLLADEYIEDGPGCNPNVEPSAPNATRETDRTRIKWNHWISPSTPIPTTSATAAVPGLYTGAVYCANGLYRPTFENKMRTLNRPFEQINTEQLVKRIYATVSPIDAFSPAGANISLRTDQSQDFHIDPTDPMTHALRIEWLIDGQLRGQTSGIRVSGSWLAPGTHTVQAVVTDPTAFVRSDPQQLLREVRTWTINVTDAPISSFTSTVYQDNLQRQFLVKDGKIFRREESNWNLWQDITYFIGGVGSGEITSFQVEVYTDNFQRQFLTRGGQIFRRTQNVAGWTSWENITGTFANVGTGTIAAFAVGVYQDNLQRQFLTRGGRIYRRTEPNWNTWTDITDILPPVGSGTITAFSSTVYQDNLQRQFMVRGNRVYRRIESNWNQWADITELFYTVGQN